MPIKNNSDITYWLLAGIFIFVLFYCGVLIFKAKVNEDNQLVLIETKLPDFVPGLNDNSMQVDISTPDGMYEDKTQALKSGVYKIFKSANSRLVNPKSVISVTFIKRMNRNFNLEHLILVNTNNLIQTFPNQKITIGIVHLPKEVVDKFEDFRMPYQTLVYYIDRKFNKPGYSCAMFLFETPDGFWSINWIAPRKILENEKGRERGIFLGMIKYMAFLISDSKSKTLIIAM